MVNKDIENMPNKKVQALIQLFYFILQQLDRLFRLILCTLISITNKIECDDKIQILLKVVLNHNNPDLKQMYIV